MPRFTVVYETRQRGAIGIFEGRKFTVTADDAEAARRAAFDKAQAAGYETRNPVSITQDLCTFVWYVSPLERFTARGTHQQDAFLHLNSSQRARVPFVEFCVEVPPGTDPMRASYHELYALSQARHR